MDINPLLDTSYADIVSHSVGCLFILLTVSFTVQKLFKMIRSHLFIFTLFSLSEETDSKKKISQRPISKNVLSPFSPGSFIFSHLTFKSLIYFVFVCHVRKFSSCILLEVPVQFSQHHLLKRLSFPHCVFLPSLS